MMTTGLNTQTFSDASEQKATEREAMAVQKPIPTPPVKVAFDKVVALLALILLAPVFAAIAAAIKVDGWLHTGNRGLVFYTEDRVNQGRIFTLYKFRVARTAAMEEARRAKGYDHVKPLEKSEENKTRVGCWLQRWYLDEMPQLFNVLKGDMSLVGPRPWPVPMYEKEISQGIYRKRLLRPGLTGLVQAHKDEAAAMGGSLVLDEAYVEACRTLGPVRLLLFDLRVIADTFGILVKGQGL